MAPGHRRFFCGRFESTCIYGNFIQFCFPCGCFASVFGHFMSYYVHSSVCGCAFCLPMGSFDICYWPFSVYYLSSFKQVISFSATSVPPGSVPSTPVQ